jgi:CDP-paratose 2-epimerase
MRALVTGGCGFLGANLSAALLHRGVELCVVDALLRAGSRSNLQWLEQQAAPGQLHHYANRVEDGEGVVEVFRRHGPFDWVAHLGGQVAMTTSLADPRLDFATNAVGSFTILEAARAFSPNAVLTFSSTNKVYGDLGHVRYAETATRYTAPDHPYGFDESLPLDFASPYGCSKGAADQYFRDWFRSFGMRTIVFRHSSIYGGRQFSTYDQGWVGWFCAKAIEQKRAAERGEAVESFEISGTGKQVRDVLHAEDLVRLYLNAFERADAVAGEVFNVGGGPDNSLSLIELFAMLSEILRIEGGLRYSRLARRHSDQDVFVADIRKANRLLGFSPEVSARDGIEEMVRWVGGLR